jgi:hypothetical protein
MKKFLVYLCVLAFASVAIAGRPILLVTPSGVFKAEVVNGVPGPWVAQEIDVIIQDLKPGGEPGPGPDPGPVPPPVSDPVVAQIAAISKANLKDVKEATAVASIIDTLSKFGLVGSKFKEALELAGPIADTSMKAEGRINQWIKQALAVTTDAAKLKAGVSSAFAVSAETLDTIHAAAKAGPTAELTAEALDWAQIIQIITMIIELLRNLGIIS